MTRPSLLTFRRSAKFRRAYENLPPAKQAAARRCFARFRANPHDPRLNNHAINRFCSLYGTTVRSVTIELDLKVIYRQDGYVITSLDIGSHDIYQ